VAQSHHLEWMCHICLPASGLQLWICLFIFYVWKEARDMKRQPRGKEVFPLSPGGDGDGGLLVDGGGTQRVCAVPMNVQVAYRLVHSTATRSCVSLSCMYCCAMLDTSGSSARDHQSREGRRKHQVVPMKPSYDRRLRRVSESWLGTYLGWDL
jgi:hypothetical protein